MFDPFLSFLGLDNLAPIEERRVDLSEFEEWTISTVAVQDVVNFNYETAIINPNFNEGNWIGVEHYKTVEEAKEGHQKWFEHCKTNPSTLEDPMRANICQMTGMEPQVFERGNIDE